MNRKQFEKMNTNRETDWRPTVVTGNGKPVEKKGMARLFRLEHAKVDGHVALDEDIVKTLSAEVISVPESEVEMTCDINYVCDKALEVSACPTCPHLVPMTV